MPISLNVNVKKIDKDRFFKGKKGVYLNLTLWETEEGSESAEYGDYIVKQTGEEGDKMPILGNAKVFEPKSKKKFHKGGKSSRRQEPEDDDDEILF